MTYNNISTTKEFNILLTCAENADICHKTGQIEKERILIETYWFYLDLFGIRTF